MTNGLFRLTLAEEMLKFRDESAVNVASEDRLRRTAMMMAGHDMIAGTRRGRIHCCVCNLEKQYCLAVNKTVTEKWKTSYPTSNIVGCAKDGCTLHAHSVQVLSDRFIFQDKDFQHLTCFQIAHHPKTSDLWASNPSFRYKPVGRYTRRPNKKKAYAVMTSHPLYIDLRKKIWFEIEEEKEC